MKAIADLDHDHVTLRVLSPSKSPKDDHDHTSKRDLPKFQISREKNDLLQHFSPIRASLFLQSVLSQVVNPRLCTCDTGTTSHQLN